MKHALRHLLPLLVLAAATPASRAADDNKPAPKEEKKQLRVIAGKDDGGPFGGDAKSDRRFAVIHPGDMGEKETVTFLGVVTGQTTPVLTTNLGLPDGTGLVVLQVESGSPVASILKEHDIFLKLDDQLLIEQRQLSVLVRNHKDGDEVTLTFLRGGKQSIAKVKLARHDVPKMAAQFNQATPGIVMGGGGFGAVGALGNFDVITSGPSGPQNREMIERMLPLMGGVNTPGVRRYQNFSRAGDSGPGERDISVTVNTGNSHVVLDDEKGSIELTIKDGKKDLVAKNAKGEQIFSGPVTTPDDRRALPGDVRERLERLEDSTQFSFKPDSDFKAETKIFRPRGQGIVLPPQPPAAPERRLMSL